MPRKRDLSPGFFLNVPLSDIDPLGRILFAGLWCLADRNGNLEYCPKKIKAQVLPYDATVQDVEKWIQQLSDKLLISFYEHTATTYLHITNFLKHQSPHPAEKALYPFPQTVHKLPVEQAVNKEDKPETVQKVPSNLQDGSQSPFNSLTLTPNTPSPEEQNMSGNCPTGVSPSESELVRQVFAHWQQTFNHPRAKLDVKRKKFIRGRLKDGFSVSDLKLAITGCRASPFHMGVNDRNTVYDDLDLICRDAKHVEQFMSYLKVGTTVTGCPLCAGEKTIPKYDDKGEVIGTSNCPACQWLNGSIGARFTLLTFGFEPEAKVDASLQNRVLTVGHWLDDTLQLPDKEAWKSRNYTPGQFQEFWRSRFPNAGKPTPEKIQQYWEEFETWLKQTK